MIENFKFMMLNQLLNQLNFKFLLKKYVVQPYLLPHNVGLLDQPEYVILETHRASRRKKTRRINNIVGFLTCLFIYF